MYGLYLISNGQKPIGPTATAFGAVLCAVFAILFWWFLKKNLKWPYIIFSAVAALMAGFVIYGSFTKDLSLWPSESWRWAGILLNGTGLIACVAGIFRMWNKKDVL
ncbi:hypothetical protein [Flavobacterium buctense]